MALQEGPIPSRKFGASLVVSVENVQHEVTVDPPEPAGGTKFEIPALREIKSPCGGPTVWSEFSALAAETGAPINLGQGFPNWNPPDFVVAAAQNALTNGFHQYTRTAGHPRLVKLLAKRYSEHFGREVDPFSQVAITIGASQALYISFQAILSLGDEVILLEPFFDLYLGQIRMAGGVVKQVPLSVVDGEWCLDVEALRSSVSPRTRAIVVNTPHNPTGKVFSRQELEAIAGVVRDNPRLLVVSDEVYEFMVYEGLGAGGEDAATNIRSGAAAAAAPLATAGGSGDGLPQSNGGSSAARDDLGAVEPLPAVRHVPFATLPGMWDRTITISSAGKTFSITGWQVGWVLGPRRVIQQIHAMLPYMQFCAATPMQEAVCTVLVDAERPHQGSPSYYDWLRGQYAGKKRRLEKALAAAGIPSLKGEGGYFLLGDVGKIKVPEKYLMASTPAMAVMTQGWAFCRWLAIEHGLVAIPTSAFFSETSRAKGLGNSLVRFCFCKTDETIEAAATVLARVAREQRELESGVDDGEPVAESAVVSTDEHRRLPFRELPRRLKMALPEWPPRALDENLINEVSYVNGVCQYFRQQEGATNELIETFETRDDDVFVCTFSKSGTTWVQQIITLLLNGGVQGEKTYSEAVPWLEWLATMAFTENDSSAVRQKEAQNWTLEALKSTPQRRFMKSHANLKDLPVGSAKGLKVIYVARNPKDVCVSLYHHIKNKRPHTFSGDMSDLICCFVQNREMNGPWFDHVLEWWEAAKVDPEHILFLHYEAMLAEPEEHVRKIAEFAGIDHTPEVIAKTADAASLSAMKQNPKSNIYGPKQHLRKGGAGGWRDVFTVRESEAFDKIYREQMKGSGLRMDFGEDLIM